MLPNLVKIKQSRTTFTTNKKNIHFFDVVPSETSSLTLLCSEGKNYKQKKKNPQTFIVTSSPLRVAANPGRGQVTLRLGFHRFWSLKLLFVPSNLNWFEPSQGFDYNSDSPSFVKDTMCKREGRETSSDLLEQ